MEVQVDEVADGIVRFSTWVPDAGLCFNQFLVTGDEPLLFHCGMRALFPSVSEAVATVLPLERLRWVSFGHVEADECGAMNSWLSAAPAAEVAFGAVGCLVSVNDLADRPPRMLNDGEVIDIGGHELEYVATPHVPHGWDAGLLFDRTTGTLLCGDLFTQLGPGPALSSESPLAGAEAAEDAFGATCLTPQTAPTLRRLAELAPTTLALMHGPTVQGDGGAWLGELADAYARRVEAAGG